jgi:hypothetical protein
MENEIKRIDIKEFRSKGYLQEVNRRFLHPLGLALEVLVDEEGNETLGGIWDYRDDEMGIIYNYEESNSDRKERMNSNKKFIDSEWKKRTKKRKSLLGYDIEKVEISDEKEKTR